MQYKIILETSGMTLSDAVNRHLADGWTPQGGVNVLCHEYLNERKGHSERFYEYYQAMVKN